MTLRTRQPTRKAGFPKILVEGGDKSGKSWSAAEFSASPKIGRTVVVAIGEDISRWDEYGLIDGARFELVLHDGTWASLMEQFQGAKDEAAKTLAAGDPPFVLVVDTVTALWDGLKDWATHRARNSDKNQRILARDPNAEIDVSTNYWNDARRRYRQFMRIVLTFPGVVILVARGSEVMLFQDGKPVSGRTTWSVEGEKNLPYDVSAHLRLDRNAKPMIISASGVKCQIRPGIDPPERLPDKWSLEWFVFEKLGLNPAEAAVGGFTEFQQDMTPEQLLKKALDPETSFGEFRALYRFADASFPGVELAAPGSRQDEPLLAILKRIGDERAKAAQGQRQQGQPAVRKPLDRKAAQEAIKAIADFDGWAEMVDAVTSAEDGERAEAEIADARASDRLDEIRGGLVLKAVRAKVALGAAGREEAAEPAA